MSSFKTHIEIEVEVFYDFQPAELMTYEYPGCDAEVTVTGVEYNGSSIGYPMGSDLFESLEQQALEISTGVVS